MNNIGIGAFEGMWGEFRDHGEDFKKLRETVPEFRNRAWFSGLKDLDVEDQELASRLANFFPEERKKHAYLYDDTMDVLRQLQDKYNLLILTNGSADLQRTKLSLSPELAPCFDHIIISGEFGTGKPSVEIFNHALGLLGVKKTEAVMIGDNPMTDILGASRAGMNSIWINHHTHKTPDVTPTFEITRLREVLPIIKSLS